ncbi:hypothetical protein MK489_02465 [Myxococcota bacterium]|nr:hypothetical protein [Myxococcota bacterium]
MRAWSAFRILLGVGVAIMSLVGFYRILVFSGDMAVNAGMVFVGMALAFHRLTWGRELPRDERVEERGKQHVR